MAEGDGVAVRVLSGVGEVSPADWDACAGTDNPFVSHAFLGALEDSEAVGAEAGWLPRHLLIAEPAGRPLGVAPLYLKGHSHGEYVFDHGWADAYERAGGRYYPKLQCAVPFTPVPGPRLLVRPDAPDPDDVRNSLIAGLAGYCEQARLSSVHVTFTTEAEHRRLVDAGFIAREGQQFHWFNRGYTTFDDFLADLASRKRKAIRKEREQVRRSGIVLEALSGDDLQIRHWDAFYRFYTNTSDRKWGWAYLNRDFFDRLHQTMRDRCVLVVAEDEGRLVGAALNLRGSDALYGRNWGCSGDYRFLHFEACYYQAIDYAIRHGLDRVEAGAQGPHKIQRGYVPVATYSAHWIPDPAFREAVERAMIRERMHVEWEREALSEHAPFRHEE